MSEPSAGVPRHIAIVMDGNGRWAKKRLMPRFVGHKAGVDAVMRIMQACIDRGVEHLTVFAFSSENWKRPADEVSALMGLVITAMGLYMKRVNEMGVRVRVVGNRENISDQLRNAWEQAEAMTAGNTKLQLNVRDVLENGGLEPIAVNPDGQKAAFRIKDPRQWFLSATFDF